jgi:hypothetical protein
MSFSESMLLLLTVQTLDNADIARLLLKTTLRIGLVPTLLQSEKIACLQSVVPEVENLHDMAAETNQQKQKRTELKKVSPHFTPGCCLQARRAESARSLPTILLPAA